jgi:predicted DNA-binding transcriptional regulator YafY
MAVNTRRQWTVSALHQMLKEDGYDVTERTLQRDLKDKISVIFPIICDDTVDGGYRWSIDNARTLDFVNFDMTTALSLNIAQAHLENTLPQVVLDKLKTKFEAAEQFIENHGKNSYARWQSRVRAIPNGKALIPAEINENVWRLTTEALLEEQQLSVTYRKPDGSINNWRIHPQGLVSRHSTNYLIVTINDYSDLKMLALHRIQTAEKIDGNCNQFDEKTITDYMNSSAMGWAYDKGNNHGSLIGNEVTLIADVSPYTASVLSETKLSEEQTLESVADTDWKRITARVPNNQETLWWIYSLNSNIRVHEPKMWVEEIKENFEKVQGMYQCAT